MSAFSDLFVRRASDFSLCETGEEGILQVQSILPESYPGHSLLTEDWGVLLGEDGCPCRAAGQIFCGARTAESRRAEGVQRYLCG